MRRLGGPLLPLTAAVVASGIGIGVALDRATADANDPAEAASSESATTVPIAQTRFEFQDIQQTGAGEARVAWADEHPTRAPESLAPEACVRAAAMLRVWGVCVEEFLVAQHAPLDVMADFAAEQATSEAWAASGCPPDPVRGKYPEVNGGYEVRVYTKSSFNGGPSVTWTGTGP
jgi:hypothetical protein